MAKVPLKTPQEVELMRESCRIVAEVLALVGSRIAPGVATHELDALAEGWIRSRGGEPAFKGYGSDRENLFPASLCISIDDQVVHGIPNGRLLEEGQVVSIDVGVKKNGFFGDGARTFPVGKVTDPHLRLLAVTEEALFRGIREAKAGNHLHDISAAVQECVEQAGFSVVRDLVGHGIGRDLHEEPPVPNFGQKGTGIVLREGMVFAIEPMVNEGTHRVEQCDDGWTIRTADGKMSAHFEHTVLIRNGEPDILTQCTRK